RLRRRALPRHARRAPDLAARRVGRPRRGGVGRAAGRRRAVRRERRAPRRRRARARRDLRARPAMRRHVLMTADTVGGVWTYALELAGALAPLEVSVTLATMGARPSLTQARAAAALSNLELVESTYALEWMPEPWRDVDAAGEWLLTLAERVRPDVVHINGY